MDGRQSCFLNEMFSLFYAIEHSSSSANKPEKSFAVVFTHRQFHLAKENTTLPYGGDGGNRNNERFVNANELWCRQLLFNGFDAHAGDHVFCRAFQVDFQVIFQSFNVKDVLLFHLYQTVFHVHKKIILQRIITIKKKILQTIK